MFSVAARSAAPAQPAGPQASASRCVQVLPAASWRRRWAAASLGAAAVVLSAAVAAGPAHAGGDSQTLLLGQEVFERNCAVCHAGGLNNIAGEEKHTLKRDALERYKLYSEEAIAAQVRAGKDAMPPFDALSDRQVAAVAAFVMSQAAGDLW